jgi:hypothetical protein
VGGGGGDAGFWDGGFAAEGCFVVDGGLLVELGGGLGDGDGVDGVDGTLAAGVDTTRFGSWYAANILLMTAIIWMMRLLMTSVCEFGVLA